MMASFTAAQVREAVASAHWNMNYHDFCRALDLREDDYSMEKFEAFRTLDRSISKLGPLFDRLLDEVTRG